MCPLRIILVFLSATLAGYFAWKTVRSPAPSTFEADADADAAADEATGDDLGASGKAQRFDVREAIGRGFWVFVDMASGRYLWRNLGAAVAAKER